MINHFQYAKIFRLLFAAGLVFQTNSACLAAETTPIPDILQLDVAPSSLRCIKSEANEKTASDIDTAAQELPEAVPVSPHIASATLPFHDYVQNVGHFEDKCSR